MKTPEPGGARSPRSCFTPSCASPPPTPGAEPPRTDPTHPLEIQSVAPVGGAPLGGVQGVAFPGGAGGEAALRSLEVLGGAAPSRVVRGAPALVAFLGG